MASQWKRLVRFVPKSDQSKILIGEPVDEKIDVGLALRNGEEVVVTVFAGTSVLAPGQRSDRAEVVDRVLSPVTIDEAGPIRCVGLNYHQHAKEMKMDLPSVPSIFLKPQFALADPWPAKSIIPRQSFEHDAADYEVELAIIIGKLCKNVTEEDALDYVLGYTAANDISSRHAQMQQSQWCYSKGFDGSCPLGPCLVSQHAMPDASKFRVRSIGHNGEVLQDGETSDFIFTVSQMVSFISQSTTLPAGTVIITGTPPGVGFAKTPPYSLKAGEELRVEISPYIGSLVSAFENET